MQALVALAKQGPVHYIVSQNVDSLHRRSGVPAGRLAEVHGNCFMERCPSCNTYYLRDFEMPSVGFQNTGRSCTSGRCRCVRTSAGAGCMRVAGGAWHNVRMCRGRLRDFVLDWEDALPEEQLARAEREASAADLILCLGTSLQITPICNLPLRTKRAGGRFAIVNLQKTPKHGHADLAIHARCDEVVERVMQLLARPIPTYVRREHFELRCWAAGDARDDVRGVPALLRACAGCLRSFCIDPHRECP